MLHQVGVGALGPVFRTYEPTRDRLVAVKVFRLDITPEVAQSLADELATAAEAGLFHPSIVEPIAAGVEGSSAYRADEYVAAETLDVAMRHYAPAPVEKVLPFITQLAGAIDFARSAGVGHGALHPRDVFVTPEEARAGGFGIVEALERVGLRAPVRRPYTAPERIAGGRWGAGADVFSLAVIGYELLTGRRPSGTGPQIAPITGGQHAAAIHSVIVRAMNEDPERRHPSALAFASDLDAASRGEGSVQPAAAVTASAPAIAVPDEEEAAAEIPPPAGVDERAEPVEADQEEAAFRASEPEFDDAIIAERHEDDARAALVGGARDDEHLEDRRLDPAAGASLFDEEALEDIAIEPAARRETDRFADEFAEASRHVDRRPHSPVPRAAAARTLLTHDEEDEARRPPAVAAPVGYTDPPAVIRETRGIGVVPWVVTTALALLVGFAAGYSVRGRVPTAADAATEAAATNTPESSAGKVTPQPYSEQAVTPPEPPQPAGDAPLTSRDLPAGQSPSASSAPSSAPSASSAVSAPTGSLEVRSTPSKAGVTLDGTWRGRTPLTIEDVSLGQHVVRVVEPGYATAREEVTLSERTPSRELSFTLQRAPTAPPRRSPPGASKPASPTPQSYTGAIYVDSRPRGAQVLVDGKLMGTTPVRIPEIRIGSHVVRLRLADHRDWTTSTRVTSGQESRVTGSLERIR